jgi:hydroxymethylbilane synthase
VEIRDADEPANQAVFGLSEFTTQSCLTEERCVVRSLHATCNTPIGVHAAKTGDDSMRLTAFVGLPDGSRWIRDELELPFLDACSRIGLNVAERLRGAGADELLAEAERLVAAG